MQESSAVELRDRWVDRFRTQAALVEEPEGRGGEASGGPQLAVGLTGEGDDHRLAIRVQNDDDATLEAVEILRKEARGEVDVREIGIVSGLSPPVQPLVGGLSISIRFGDAGTLGCVVQKRGLPGSHHLLSNNHVLARLNFAQPHDLVEQPARVDQIGAGPFAVAEFGEAVRLEPQPFPNLVDAAIVSVLSGITCDPGGLAGTPKRLAGVRTTPLQQDERLFKVGKATSETTGIFQAWGIRMLTVRLGSRLFDFDDQIEIAPEVGPFCSDGDSGSIVFDEQNLAVGLLFAKSEKTEEAYANPIGAVLTALQIELA